MIELGNISDRPHLFGEHKVLLEHASLVIPKGRYALLSATPELHPALIDIIAGTRPPRHGFVHHDVLVSWPIGRMGFVRGKMTGVQMTDFICDLYGLDRIGCMDFLYGMLTDPDYIRKRIMDWPGYIRQEYTFSLALIPNFDVFIIDNVMPLDKSRFGRLWGSLFEERLVGRSLILANYSPNQLMDYCTKGLIYEQGSLRIDDDLEGCIQRYPLKQSRAEQSSDAGGEDGGDFDEYAAEEQQFL